MKQPRNVLSVTFKKKCLIIVTDKITYLVSDGLLTTHKSFDSANYCLENNEFNKYPTHKGFVAKVELQPLFPQLTNYTISKIKSLISF